MRPVTLFRGRDSGVLRRFGEPQRLGAPGISALQHFPDDEWGARGGRAYDRLIGEVAFGAAANFAAFWTQPKFFDAMVSQAESLPRSAAQVAATGDYDDVPSVVLSASSSSPSEMKGREALARLSFHGKHIINAHEPSAQHSCQI